MRDDVCDGYGAVEVHGHHIGKRKGFGKYDAGLVENGSRDGHAICIGLSRSLQAFSMLQRIIQA